MRRTDSSINRWLDASFIDFFRTLIDVTSWRFAKALGLLLFSVLTEGAGLMLLIPLLQLVGLDVQSGVTGRVSEAISYVFNFLGLKPVLPLVLVLYVLIVSSQALLSRWQATENLLLQQEVAKSLRVRLYVAMTRASWPFLAKMRSSDILQVLTNEIDRIGLGTYYLLTLLVSVITSSIYLFFAIQLSWVATGLVLLCGLALTLLQKRGIKNARITGREVSLATKKIYAAGQEHIAAIKTTKSYGAEERNIAIFSGLAEDALQRYHALGHDLAVSRAAFEIGSVIILSLIFYIAIELIHMPLANLLILFFLFARILPRFSNIQQSYQQFQGLLPAYTSFKDLLHKLEDAAEQMVIIDRGIKINDGIRLNGVSFGYNETSILDDLDLFIPAGKTVAVVGPSGAGKSTLADLIMGLLLPTKGSLLVDGSPLTAQNIYSWRSRVGYVSQDTFLFNDTIKSNLLWACPGASDLAIQKALLQAAAEEFVLRLPLGLETVLGDRGVAISGGERQRLALARALLRQPDLLLLDEATSNIDSENENKIQESIERLHGSTTVLIITHRLSTIRNVDVIYVLERGRLVESGSWTELIALGGRFNALCNEQGVNG